MNRVVTVLGLSLVLASAGYLLILGASALLRPKIAARFLSGLATTQALHITELAIRIVVGIAFVSSAPHVAFSPVIAALGWVLIGTSVVLALVPWRLHQRFAAWSVPQALQYLPLIGFSSLAGGLGLVAAVLLPRAAA